MDTTMKTPPIVTLQEWEAARQRLLVKEKEVSRARDAVAAERRRMPWLAVEKDYAFDGPDGKKSLLDLFEGRRQLIIYRAFFEPGVHGWPDHACVGCSLMADQVADVVHLNQRPGGFGQDHRGRGGLPGPRVAPAAGAAAGTGPAPGRAVHGGRRSGPPAGPAARPGQPGAPRARRSPRPAPGRPVRPVPPGRPCLEVDTTDGHRPGLGQIVAFVNGPD